MHLASPRSLHFGQFTTALIVLFSIIFLTLAIDQKAYGQSLDQPTINAINILGAFNIGTGYQPPQQMANGVVIATQIGSDGGFPGIITNPSIKPLLYMVREAIARKALDAANVKVTMPPVPLPPYTRRSFVTVQNRFASTSAKNVCTHYIGAENCEPGGKTVYETYYEKCKPTFIGNGPTCAQDATAYNQAQAAYTKYYPTEQAIQAELQRAATDPAARMKLAPFMIEVAWEALASDNPNAAQQIFRKYFEYYAARQNQVTTQHVLVDWCKFKQNWGHSPVSFMIGTGPTSSAFTPQKRGYGMGANGLKALDALMTPAVVTDLEQRDPFWKGEPLAVEGRPMDHALRTMGFSGPSAAAVIQAMSGKLPTEWPNSGMPLAGKVEGFLNGTVVPEVAQKAAVQIVAAVLEGLIEGLEGVALPVSIIAIAIEILVKNIIAQVETKQFEIDLISHSKSPQPVDSHALIHTNKPGYADNLKIGILAYLVKMMVTDPSDGAPFAKDGQFAVLDPLVAGVAASDPCAQLAREGLLSP